MESWLAELERGHSDLAWDRFLERYRRLIFAAIRHYAHDHDDVMDVFTHVCEALREDDLRRLRAYAAGSEHRARFTTWLVVVVRHLTVDWLRERHGRTRPSAASNRLTSLQRQIYQYVFLEGHSAGEAYELVRSRGETGLRYGAFLKELAAVHRVLGDERPRSAPSAHDGHPFEATTEPSDPALDAEARRILSDALAALPAEDRAAVQLYVVEDLPAAEVARVLGLPNAKAVYNRVYRALAAVRERLTLVGIRRDSL